MQDGDIINIDVTVYLNVSCLCPFIYLFMYYLLLSAVVDLLMSWGCCIFRHLDLYLGCKHENRSSCSLDCKHEKAKMTLLFLINSQGLRILT